VTYTGWLIYNRNLFLTVVASESRVPALSGPGKSPLPNCRVLSSHCILTWQKKKKTLWIPFIRPLILLYTHMAPPLWIRNLPKALTPNIIRFGRLGFEHINFGRTQMFSPLQYLRQIHLCNSRVFKYYFNWLCMVSDFFFIIFSFFFYRFTTYYILYFLLKVSSTHNTMFSEFCHTFYC
jgi:hypothetical protein